MSRKLLLVLCLVAFSSSATADSGEARGDAGKIAFVAPVRAGPVPLRPLRDLQINLELYVSPAAKEQIERLSITSGVESDPVWSPDGSRIAYGYTPAGSNVNVLLPYVTELTGKNRRRLTYSTCSREFHVRPSWSPDGRRIAFACGYPRPYLYVASAEYGEEKRLSDKWVSDLAWSAVGETIAFVTPRFTRDDIVLVDSDGREESTIVKGGTGKRLRFPVWSTDGQRLAFLEESQGPGAGARGTVAYLRVVGSDGRGERRLTGAHYGMSRPVWSPDGSRIAYATGPNAHVSSTSIYVLDLASGDERPVVESVPSRTVFPLAWSPDGEGIGYVLRDEATASATLYTVEIRSGRTAQLIGPLVNALSFDWYWR